MSRTQVVVALAAGVSTIVTFGCLILVVVVRLRRLVKSQLDTLDSLLSTLRSGQDHDKPGAPS